MPRKLKELEITRIEYSLPMGVDGQPFTATNNFGISIFNLGDGKGTQWKNTASSTISDAKMHDKLTRLANKAGCEDISEYLEDKLDDYENNEKENE